MSQKLYSTGGLRFWSEDEIELREAFQSRVASVIRRTLLDMNPAFRISAATAEWAAATAMAACATVWAARAAACANYAGLPYDRQRAILVRLIKEAAG